MKDKNGKTIWPRWHDVLDLITMPYLGAFICMVIAPLYIFSAKVRKEIDNDGADGSFTILIFIWIGTILWVIGFILGAMMLVELLKT